MCAPLQEEKLNCARSVSLHGGPLACPKCDSTFVRVQDMPKTVHIDPKLCFLVYLRYTILPVARGKDWIWDQQRWFESISGNFESWQNGDCDDRPENVVRKTVGSKILRSPQETECAMWIDMRLSHVTSPEAEGSGLQNH